MPCATQGPKRAAQAEHLVRRNNLLQSFEALNEEPLGCTVARRMILDDVEVGAKVTGLGVLVRSNEIVERFDGFRFHQATRRSVNPKHPIDPSGVAKALREL